MMRELIRAALPYSAALVFVGCGSDKITPASSGFDGQIDIRYVASDNPAEVRSAVRFAVDKWTRAPHKNLGDFHLQASAGQCFPREPQLNEIHHNLLVFVLVARADGANGLLAGTQVCQLSDRDYLPVVSVILVDLEDVASMRENGTLQQVMLHEMGHALGFNPKTYLPKQLGRGDPRDPVFIGNAAKSEFATHVAWYGGEPVPLEKALGIGPQDPHWRYSVFGDELMVPVLFPGFKSPLSTVTLGLFEDLGYTVDYSVADPYEAAPPSGAMQRLPQVSLKNDFEQRPAPKLVTPID